MKARFYLLLFLLTFGTVAMMPYRGTIQTTTGTAISGAKITAITNRASALSNSEGFFGNGVTSIVTGDIGNISIAKPVLHREALYFNAAAGQDYSFRLIDARGRSIERLTGKAESSGMQRVSLANNLLADGFYITILNVGNKRKEIFKSIIAGNRAVKPQQLTNKSVNRVYNTAAPVTEVSLVDTLYISAKGYKNKIVTVSDTGSVGTITLEAVGSEPEIFCHDISLAYTPDNFPLNRKDTVALNMALFNGGGANALSVKCSIATADPEITIVAPTVGFDNIAAGSSKAGMSTFRMLIPRGYDGGKNIPFKVIITDSWGGSWDCADLYMPYPFKVTKQKLDDDMLGGSQGNGNGKCELSEIIEYTPQIKNMSGRDLNALTAHFGKSNLVDTYMSKFYPNAFFTQTIGSMKNGQERVTPLDFQIITKAGATTDFKEDLLIRSEDEYFLLPVDLNDDTMEEPVQSDAELKCAAFTLAYDEINFPLHREDSMVFSIGIENVGTGNALSVACSLSTLTAGITVDKRVRNFDNIPVGDTSYPLFQKRVDTFLIKDSTYNLTLLYNVQVPRTFPAGQEIDFVLTMKDSWGKIWLDTVQYIPHPFAISQDMIDDDSIPASKGDGDGIIELGETIEYIPQLQNFTGTSIANITGQMMQNESFEYIDDIWKYGTIENGVKKLPEFDYVFKVSNSKYDLNSSDMLLVSRENGDSTFYILPLGLKASGLGVPLITVMNDTVVDKDVPITLTANAIDYDGDIVKYIWSKNGVDFTDSTDLGEYNWSSSEAGFHKVYVKALDNDGKASQVGIIGVSVRGNAFSKTLGTANSDLGVCIRQKSNGDIWVLSTKGHAANGIADVWLIALDEHGDTLWTKTYGENNDDYAGRFQFTDDGGALAMWSSHGFTPEEKFILFCRLDENGDSLWTKRYATGGNVNCYDLQPVNDGYYATVRMTDTISSGTGDEIFWLLRLNANADTLWSVQNNYGRDFYTSPRIAVTSDGGCFMSIIKRDTETTLSTPFVYRYSSSGEEQWVKFYTSSDTSYYSAITLLDNDGFLLSGSRYSDGSEYAKVTFCDVNGVIIREKSFGQEGQEYHMNSAFTVQDGVVLAGYKGGATSNGTDLTLAKIDLLGNVVWERQYDYAGDYDKALFASPASDGGILVTGFADATSIYGEDGEIWVMKTNVDGTLIE